MTVGSWNPDAEKEGSYSIDIDVLARFARLADEETLVQLHGAVSDDEIQAHAAMMQCTQEQWQSATETLSDDTLLRLIRFFTVAEMQLPGWRGEEKSPVIAINKALKRRGVRLPKDLLLWIKAESDNRFLPNGPLLL